MNLQELIQKTEYCINYNDTAEAQWLVRPWKIFLSSASFSQQTPRSQEQLRILAQRLRVVAFPHLEDNDSAEILEHHFLDFFDITQSLDSMFMEKLFLVPYSSRNELREKLKSALLKNNQRLGQIMIGEWLKKFDQGFDPKKRTADAIVSFLNRSASMLSTLERQKLKTILHIYDYYLIYTMPETGEEFEKLKEFYLKQAAEGVQPQVFPPAHRESEEYSSPASISEKLPLRDLLRKYPAVGEQAVTSGQLKLSHFDKPVRPSVKNWIYDYTSQLGRERHDSMQRMKYLFGSANGKNLASPDREKLGIILKSFDENVPLPIDATRNEIVFDNPQPENPKSEIRNPKQIQNPNVQILKPVQPEKKPYLKQPFIKPYRKISEPPELNLTAKPQISTLENKKNIPDTRYQIPDTKYQYTNPYPKPGTHEPQFSKPAENISNLRFDEGLPQKSISRARPEPPKSTLPPKKFIYPHDAGREKTPEPRIEGNIVDLKGDSK